MSELWSCCLTKFSEILSQLVTSVPAFASLRHLTQPCKFAEDCCILWCTNNPSSDCYPQWNLPHRYCEVHYWPVTGRPPSSKISRQKGLCKQVYALACSWKDYCIQKLNRMIRCCILQCFVTVISSGMCANLGTSPCPFLKIILQNLNSKRQARINTVQFLIQK